jgi:hypothetical protein
MFSRRIATSALPALLSSHCYLLPPAAPRTLARDVVAIVMGNTITLDFPHQRDLALAPPIWHHTSFAQASYFFRTSHFWDFLPVFIASHPSGCLENESTTPYLHHCISPLYHLPPRACRGADPFFLDLEQVTWCSVAAVRVQPQ